MVLRQVDWSLRHHPTAAATQRHLRLARIITADIGHTPIQSGRRRAAAEAGEGCPLDADEQKGSHD